MILEKENFKELFKELFEVRGKWRKYKTIKPNKLWKHKTHKLI
jgi:hypothetical protein